MRVAPSLPGQSSMADLLDFLNLIDTVMDVFSKQGRRAMRGCLTIMAPTAVGIAVIWYLWSVNGSEHKECRAVQAKSQAPVVDQWPGTTTRTAPTNVSSVSCS